MLRYLYSAALYLLTPFILLRLLWRARKNSGYCKRWGERFAFFTLPRHYKQAIWVHSVSVGESMIAIPLIKALQKQYPETPIVVTTMTPTGSECIKKGLGDSVFHVYVPYDLPCVIKRFLKKVSPRLCIILETEIWPNLLHYTHQKQIPIMIANARISDGSINGYLRFKKFFGRVLENVTHVAAQTESDAYRLIQLNMDPSKVEVTGNIKFDITVPASIKESAELLRQQLGNHRQVIMAGSTHEGEETLILEAYRKIKRAVPDALLILVPRHPERFDRANDLCQQAGFNVVRRSESEHCDNETDVYLGDTMGEMLLLYAVAHVAFVGGSLIHFGGHNLLEPAAFSLPLLSGPHTFNFRQVTALLQEAQAIAIVHNAEDFEREVVAFLQDVDKRQLYGERAHQVVMQNRGALEKHLEIIRKLLAG